MAKVSRRRKNLLSREYERVHVPCLHETDGENVLTLVPDHHSLTKKQIHLLLRKAKQTGDYRVRNSIQIRLCQGIKGYTCPLSGETMNKENAVSQLFLDNMKKAPTSLLVSQFFNLMN